MYMTEDTSTYSEILESGRFQTAWYLEQYKDVAASGQDPLEHFLSYGVAEGRDPGPDFSTSGYLSRYQDVAEAGINPLLHYIRYGRQEGRLTTPCLDPDSIKRSYSTFSEYLVHSMVSPIVEAPFGTVDLAIFRLMDHVARWLCRKQGACDKTPLVSVIMPMRDRASVVGDAVRSVLEQSYEKFELLVVDDGSQDDSASVVRTFGDSRIRVMESYKSTGVSATRNRGLEVARGELIAYLDSDNSWREDYLSAMVGAFQSLPDADAAYSGQYLYRGCESEPFAVRFGSYNPSLLRNHNYIDLNCFVHRRDVLESAGGGFCESLRRWVDWELILRISRQCKVYSVPILQSNYYIERVDNTISDTEALEPARKAIMGKWGYDDLEGSHQPQEILTERVDIIVPVDSSAPEDLNDIFEFELEGVQTYFTDAAGKYFKGGRPADSISDILILNRQAILRSDALQGMQKTAYQDDAIGMVVPQFILPGGDPGINIHVPSAFNDAPCDIALSNHYKNIENPPLFHAGGQVELNFTPFFCVYIKRKVWDLCDGLTALQRGDDQSCRVLCEFVRHVLDKKIIYTPDAVVLHLDEPGSNRRCL